jgi:phage gpG-like protein
MANEISLKFNLPRFAEAAARAEAELPGLLAATLQTQRAMIFDSEGKYNGRPGWAPLKCRKGQILKDRGTLSQSIGPQNDGIRPGAAVGSIVRITPGIVTIGTNIAYAAVHQYSATIRPVKAKALRFKCNGHWTSRKKVFIPARPFADFTSADVSEIRQTVENYLGELLGGFNT